MNQEKIISHFGDEFFRKVIFDLGKYAVLWGLQNYEQVDYYSVNCIFKCASDRYGQCILKIGNPCKETKTEYQFLLEYNGGHFCKVYESDIENGVLLIECITPGIQLRAQTDIDIRINEFCNLHKCLHIKPKNKDEYPTYMGWVSRITEYLKDRKDYKHLYKYMSEAEQVCQILCKKYMEEMLLHGDLHHDNILLGEDDCYHIIDPKGVIGDPVYDIPRFILNEFEDDVTDEFTTKITYIMKSISKKMIVPESDIRKLVFVEMAMAESWNVESGQEPNIANVEFAKRLMLDFLQ